MTGRVCFPDDIPDRPPKEDGKGAIASSGVYERLVDRDCIAHMVCGDFEAFLLL